MPLPEVAMSDSFRGPTGLGRTPLSPVRAGRAEGEPAGPCSRGHARLFWGLGFAWIVASATVAAQLFQGGVLHPAPGSIRVARTSGVPFSVR